MFRGEWRIKMPALKNLAMMSPTSQAWDDYGGRGITIEDPRWMEFIHFHADMGDAPPGMSLDRIDNDRGYCAANCRWADKKTQANNRRSRWRNRTNGNAAEEA
jgi:hypothetical protein